MKKFAIGFVLAAAVAPAGVAPAQTNPYTVQNPGVTVQAAVPYPGYVYAPGAGPGLGAAAVIGAQSQYMQGVQSTYLQREDVKRSKLQTKRAALDEWNYEQANSPTREDLRAKDRAELLRHTRNEPPATEIWSGQALNLLLQNLQKMGAAAPQMPTPMLSQDMLKRINVTGSRTDVNVGLLKDNGKLQWPFPLRAPGFDADRQKIDQQLQLAVQQARSGEVSYDIVNKLGKSVDQMLAHLKGQINDMGSGQWMQSKRYVDQLKDGVKTLQDPNVANYFNGQWTAQGNTVGELVAYMTTNGLRFTPATHGEENAYQVLYQGMLSYDTALGQRSTRAEMSTMAANKPAKPSPFRK